MINTYFQSNSYFDYVGKVFYINTLSQNILYQTVEKSISDKLHDSSNVYDIFLVFFFLTVFIYFTSVIRLIDLHFKTKRISETLSFFHFTYKVKVKQR